MIFKRILFQIIILMLIGTSGTGQPHKAQHKASGHSALYIDSVHGFSFRPFYGRGRQASISFLNGMKQTSSVITVTDSAEKRDAFSSHKRALVKRGFDLSLDTSFNLAGNAAVIFGGRGKIEGVETNFTELNILTPLRTYTETAVRPAVSEGYSREDIQGVLTYLDFEHKDSQWADPKEKPKIIVVDSIMKFSFAPHQEESLSDSMDIFAIFYGSSDQGGIMVGQDKRRWTLAGWREHQGKAMQNQGVKILMDSTVHINGREGILWRFDASFRGKTYTALSLSIISNDRVYMIISLCEKKEFTHYEGLFLKAFYSFQVL